MFSWKNKFGYFAKYISGGLLNTIIGFAIIFILMALGVAPVTSNIIGYLVGLVLSFSISRSYVFCSDGRILSEIGRYVVFFAICFAINILVLKYALDVLRLDKVLAQLAAAATYTMLMYIFSYYFVFMSKK